MAGEGIGSICMEKKKYFADCFSLTNRHFRYLASVFELDHLKEIPVYSSLHRHTSAEEHKFPIMTNKIIPAERSQRMRQ